MRGLACLFGFHRWRWYGLQDHDIRKPSLHVSQCDECRKIVGGWRGKHDLWDAGDPTHGRRE